ncbi:MAG: PKD domain-containing protein [Bacteroidia bacterium]
MWLTQFRRRPLLLVLLFTAFSAFTPLFLPPPGLTSPEAIGPFLNNTLPDKTPGNGGSVAWSVTPAYINLYFDDPLVIVPDERANKIFVGSRDGVLEVFDDNPNVTTKQTVVDLRTQVAEVWDAGFLGMALHPDFGLAGSPDANYVYLYYTAKGANGQNGPFSCGGGCFTCFDNPNFFGSYLRLSRFTLDPSNYTIDPATEVRMFNIRQYNGTHRGGGMVFGDDGYLYLTIGDQARYTGALNIVDNFEGGVVRLDVDQQGGSVSHAPRRKMGVETGLSDEFTGVGYYVPNSNPWQAPDNSLFEEFYTVGHRSPHRMTKDRATGDLFIGEVGGGQREEINIVESGRNYGWPIFEGNLGPSNRCNSGTTINFGTYKPPLTDFLRSEANAIIGGYVYRGNNYPNIAGQYICGGYSQNRIFSIDPATGTKTVLTSFTPGGLITFGESNDGELIMGRQNGNTNLYALTGTGIGAPAPTLLSQVDAFSDLQTLTPKAGVIPYDMIEDFWSDGADKDRWIAIPNDGTHDTPDEQIQFSENGNWTFPKGAVLIKHFELFGKRLETRFEVHGIDGTYYYLTYKWNAQGTDATLLTDGLDETITVNGQSQVWHFPSTSECQNCHQSASGFVLGARTRYLNRDIVYPQTGLSANQLVSLSHIGILDQPISDTDAANYLTAVAKDDPNASLEIKARSYLDLNCSYCHQPGTGNRAVFDARLTTDLSNQDIINGSVIEALGLSDARVIVPQNVGQSVTHYRMNSLLSGVAMPPLAKNKIDTEGVQLIEDWINSLTPDTTQNLVVVGDAVQQAGGCYELTAAQNSLAGAAWYPEVISLDEDATITFNIGMGSNDAGADGATFIFQNQGTDVIGTLGGGLGATGITPSLGISFDTYGQVDDQIVIWQNGAIATALAGPVCALPSCVNIEDGGTHAVEIQWDAGLQRLQVLFDGSLRATYTDNVVQTIFGGNPWVYVGATAATGGLNNLHEICNFDLDATFPPEQVNPGGTGITASYFNNIDFTSPAFTRIDPQINFAWGNDSPDPLITDPNTFSVRWEGGLVAPYTGTFTFYSTTDDGVRLWVDGVLVIDQYIDQAPTEWTGTYDLVAGELVPFKMDYYERAGGAVAKLEWAGPFTERQFVQPTFLFPVGAVYSPQPPVASFTVTPNVGIAPLPVIFDAIASNDPDGSIASYDWDFGDGNTATGLTPLHTYNTDGTYNARLIVTDDGGKTDTAFQTIQVDASNTAPVASFTASPNAGTAPLLVSVDATASNDDNGIQTYDWDFGDGATGNGQITDHTYLVGGTFTITLIVSDQEGLKDTATTSIDVQPAGGYCHVLANGEVVIEAENFSDNVSGSGGASATTWQIYNDAAASGGVALRAEPNTGVWTGLNLNGPRLDYDILFDVPGQYYVYVRASAASGSDDSFHAGLNGNSVTNQSGTGMGVNGPWDWSERANNYEVVVINVPSTGKHTFNLWMREDGTQVDKIVIKAASATPSGNGPAESQIGDCGTSVGNQAPIANFTSDVISGFAPLPVNFDAANSTDNEGPIASYSWNFGDGNTAAGVTASNTYSQAGIYTISLTVTDQGGLSDTYDAQVQVSNDPGNGEICFDEAGGELVIEAENYSALGAGTGSAAGVAWVNFTDASASNGAGVRAEPNTGTWTGLNLNGPRLDYNVNFNAAGTYQVYVRTSSPTANDDSYHVGLNGVGVTNLSGYGMGGVGPWFWASGANDGDQVEIVVPAAGKHTISVWMREDGVALDKLVITQLSAPTAAGPIESSQVTCGNAANLAPIASFTATPSSGIAPLPVAVDGSTSSDPDGQIAAYAWDFGDGTTTSGLTANHTYNNAGTFNIVLTVTDTAGLSSQTSQSITVSPSGNGPLCFDEVNGELVMEAENYSAIIPGTGNAAGHTWQTYTEASASGSAAVIATPNTGASAGLNLTGPRLDYEINFATAGTYRVFVRSAGASNADDSYHVGLNGVSTTNLSGYGMGANGPWAWKDVANNSDPVTLVVATPGQYVFNLWMREDGVEVDKIVMRIIPTTFSGLGPVESPRNPCGAPALMLSRNFGVEGYAQDANINWGNFYEEFEDQYILQRSFDGKIYELLEKDEIIVDKELNTYTDPNIRTYDADKVYYRLQVVDAFGQVRETREGSLNLRTSFASLNLQAYPNPANTKLSLKYANQSEETLRLRVISSTGQTIYTQSIDSNAAEGIVKLDVSEWAAGIYFIQLTNDSASQVVRVLIY